MARFGHVLKKRFFPILLLSTAILLFSAFFLWQSKRKDPAVYLVYTVVVGTDPAHAAALSVGDRLTDAVAKGDAGVILGITREPLLLEDEEGVYTREDKVMLAVRIGSEGRMAGDGARISELTPRVGEALYLYAATRIEGLCVRVRAITL